MNADKKLLWFATGILAASWLMTAQAYARLPDPIPIHFGISGEPDSWSAKGFLSAFAIPLVQTFISILLLVFRRIPQYSNIPSTIALEALAPVFRERAFEVIRRLFARLSAAINTFMILLQWQILQTAVMNRPHLNTSITIVMLAGFLLIMLLCIIQAVQAMRRVVSEATPSRP